MSLDERRSGLRVRGFAFAAQPGGDIPVTRGPAARALLYARRGGETGFRRLRSAKLGGVRCAFPECYRRTTFFVPAGPALASIRRVLVCFPGRAFRRSGVPGRCPRVIRP